MPWTKQDYPDSFKNLDDDVRNKAIEIANALLKEKYEESRAIPIAISKAREYVHGGEARDTYEVKTKNDEWVLLKKGETTPIFTADAKEDLLDKAKPYVNDYDGILNIYHVDGSLEDTLYQ